MTAEQSEPQAGSVAEEAARLVASLYRAAHTSQGSSEGPASEEPDCQWCPICRSVAAARQVSPESLARLADLAALAAAVLSEFAGQRRETRGADRSTATHPGPDDGGTESSEGTGSEVPDG
ncbi:MAG: hypothetical protein ACRCXL_05000 [Dermatophilaceae bacterium]